MHTGLTWFFCRIEAEADTLTQESTVRLLRLERKRGHGAVQPAGHRQGTRRRASSEDLQRLRRRGVRMDQRATADIYPFTFEACSSEYVRLLQLHRNVSPEPAGETCDGRQALKVWAEGNPLGLQMPHGVKRAWEHGECSESEELDYEEENKEEGKIVEESPPNGGGGGC
ncbi:hypothetical protein NDU88_002932 [Pleurodeles waltl]|uniref:Uncharacterized protein n=1 Tax=Pleurodeles waltl TaxID=8319 RepID=A0AAV7M217_PLEWA|nr:hypothetical protein NDU88_002932 [Pleurodeles waltl]